MWYHSAIPKDARVYIRQLATDRLGARFCIPFPNQSNRNRHKKKVFGSKRGKWMFTKGQFYFRKEEDARLYEQEVTLHFLNKQGTK